MTSENLTLAKRETHFLGFAETAPMLTSEEENDAFPEKGIKTKPEVSWQGELSKSDQDNESEVGMGRKVQLSPISLARASPAPPVRGCA